MKNSCHSVVITSRKSRRAVCSIKSGEAYAFVGAFYAAFAIVVGMGTTFGRYLSMQRCTDSKQLCDALKRGK